MASIADEIEYKLDAVKVTSVPSDDIDKTFRSSCIGESQRPQNSARHSLSQT
jgi:hypothetical protein